MMVCWVSIRRGGPTLRSMQPSWSPSRPRQVTLSSHMCNKSTMHPMEEGRFDSECKIAPADGDAGPAWAGGLEWLGRVL